MSFDRGSDTAYRQSLRSPGANEDEEARAPLHIREDTEEADPDTKCGMPRSYRLAGIICIVLFFTAGFAVIIWNAVKGIGGGHSPPVGAPLTLDGVMFNRSVAPTYASLAWINANGADASDGGVQAPDQFVSIINGSFYVTQAGAIDQPPTLIISAADLNKFASFTPPAPTVKSSKKHTGRRLLDAEEPAMPDAADLHARYRPSSSGGAPTTARTLRTKPNHHNAHQPHSAQHDAHHASHAQHNQQSFAASVTEHLNDPAAPVFRFSTYAFSSDQEHMLFGVNCTQLYRHSSFCNYLIYDIKAVQMTPLANGASLRLASWSPAAKADLIAYVQDNNIYLYFFQTGTTKQITTDGLWDSVINGVQDWVSEEEIFEATSALWWSPDGLAFAWLRFDESAVPKYGFDFYTEPYNQGFSYKYPLPGFQNSVVDIRTYNVTSDQTSKFDSLRTMFDYEYVMNVVWYDATALIVRLENRAQNYWQLVKLTGSNTVTKLSSETAQQYHEPNSALTSLAPLPYYVDLVNNGGDSLQLALYSIVDGTRIKFLTGGAWTGEHSVSPYGVLALNAVNIGLKSASIYFTRTVSRTAAMVPCPTLWSVTTDTMTNGTADMISLVDYSSDGSVGRTTWQSGSFSPSAGYFLLQESSIIPMSTLYKINADGSTTVLKVSADNTQLVQSTSTTFAVPSITYTTIDSNIIVDGTPIQMPTQIISPAGVDLGDLRQSPVLIYAYGGPGSQTVTTSYPLGYASISSFLQLLSSQFGFVVVIVDPVGTFGRGETYQKSHTYLNLGIHERADMLSAARWVGQQSWANADEISYFGWSYGGFMTSFTAAAGSGLFANLLTVAPVTSWLLYDSVYTERYMLTPALNPDGYSNTSVIEQASPAYEATNWHLFGGTADDNVHFQNSALLVDALIDLDLPLNIFYFPNRAHSLTQWKTGLPPKYLYEKLIEILTGGNGPNGNGASASS